MNSHKERNSERRTSTQSSEIAKILNSAPPQDRNRQWNSTTPSHDGSDLVQSTPPQAASASFIRSRFLNRLGISKAARAHMDPANSSSRAGTSCSRPRSGSFQENLKADHGKPDDTVGTLSCSFTSSSTQSSSPSSPLGRGVSFETAVTVHFIPSRTEYSKRIRTTIWTSPLEMQENTARNCLEFAAENWDWRQVADDQDMVAYAGEKIHPVHFVQECSMRQQFLQVMSSRQQH